MFLVLCGLLWILLRIVTGRSNLWLINANAATALVVLYACAFVNVDGHIAAFNVRHCREVGGRGVPVDLWYLQTLGPDALPAVVWLAGELGDSSKTPEIAQTVFRLKAMLRRDLRDWRGWTYRRHRLTQLKLPDGTPTPRVNPAADSPP